MDKTERNRIMPFYLTIFLQNNAVIIQQLYGFLAASAY